MTAYKNEFSQEDIEAFKPSEKVGLLACINPEGLPHISLITSMQANNPKELLIGQFVTGLSKKYIQQNHKIGFLILTFERVMWRGFATWTHLAKEGPEYEKMNLIPMFRYNTYFGINTVHYCDLNQVSERSPLPMTGIILEALKTRIGKGSLKTNKKERILKPFVQDMFNGLANLKFLAYVREDGFPTIIPVIQCQASDSTRLAFSTGVFSDELKAIPAGAQVAVFCMNFGIEDVLVRGTYNGLKRSMGVNLGTVDIDWVYNSMPPAIGQVYPSVALEPVTEF
ncbi:MAG: hypothetical protein JXA42_16040 [Anaerolineales bacterium]|nr:hypothetical protein [Anaerolineales bacterium]